MDCVFADRRCLRCGYALHPGLPATTRRNCQGPESEAARAERTRRHRADMLAALLDRLGTCEDAPRRRPRADAERLARHLVDSGCLDSTGLCDRTLWDLIRDLRDPAGWRAEWGVAPAL